MRPTQLTSSQLCDLLNYVLRRSEWNAISSVVVRSWDKKDDYPMVENWCDRQLIDSGAMPDYPRRAGQKPGLRVPRVLEQFILQSILQGRLK